MTFSDDDLKRLKKDMQIHDTCRDCQPTANWRGLLARLEAAEAVILKIEQAKLHDGCELRANDLSLEAWRKAAGK